MQSATKAGARAAPTSAGKSAKAEYAKLRKFMESDPALPAKGLAVVYIGKWGKATMEAMDNNTFGALGFAAPCSYNQIAPVFILRDGVEVATYDQGHFKSEDKELTQDLKSVEGDDEYTATINGKRTPIGGLHAPGSKNCTCYRCGAA